MFLSLATDDVKGSLAMFVISFGLFNDGLRPSLWLS